MKQDPSHKHTFSPLLRWLTGSATRHDEQALEAAAKTDPFLADALDGYRSAPEADHLMDLTRLKAQLRQKAKKKRGLVFYTARIAAVGLVLVGIGWAMQQFQAKEEMGMLAETSEMAKNVEPTGSSAAQAADSVASTEAEYTPDAAPLAGKTEYDLKKDAQPPAPPKVSNAPLRQNKPIRDTEEYTAKDAPLMNASESSPTPVAEAPKAEPVPESGAMVYEEAAAKTANKKRNTAENKPFPFEKKKLKTTDAPSPIGGFDQFATYVATNLRHPEAAKLPRPAYTVWVEFAILNDGTPANFDIKGEAPQAYKDEAIRLLQEGPKWTGPSAVKASYAFVFE